MLKEHVNKNNVNSKIYKIMAEFEKKTYPQTRKTKEKNIKESTLLFNKIKKPRLLK